MSVVTEELSAEEFPGVFRVFRPQLNPHVRTATAHLDEWVLAHGLIRTVAARNRFEHANFGWFAAATYPTADEPGLCLIADWFAWLFLLDDLLDDGLLGRDPGGTSALMAQFFEVLGGDGTTVPDRAPGLVTALADLWRRTDASAAWRARFVQHVIEGGLAARWEADNRVRGVIPDVESYVEKRRHTGAIYVCMDLIEVADRIDLPDSLYQSTEFAAVLRSACDVVCWTNDLYSLDKETALGEHHNLVTVIQHNDGLDQKDAANAVADLIVAEVRTFLRHEAAVLAASPAHAALLSRCLAGMRSWMRGNLDWSASTRRYRDTDAALATSARYHGPSSIDEAITGRGK